MIIGGLSIEDWASIAAIAGVIGSLFIWIFNKLFNDRFQRISNDIKNNNEKSMEKIDRVNETIEKYVHDTDIELSNHETRIQYLEAKNGLRNETRDGDDS